MLHCTEHNTIEVTSGGGANMTRLSAATLYRAWVRARSRHSPLWTDSAALALRTYPAPAPLALRRAAAYRLHVLWPAPTAYHLHA